MGGLTCRLTHGKPRLDALKRSEQAQTRDYRDSGLQLGEETENPSAGISDIRYGGMSGSIGLQVRYESILEPICDTSPPGTRDLRLLCTIKASDNSHGQSRRAILQESRISDRYEYYRCRILRHAPLVTDPCAGGERT